MRSTCFWLVLLALSAAALSGQQLDRRPVCSDPPFEAGELVRFVAKVGFVKVGEGVGGLWQVPEVEMPGTDSVSTDSVSMPGWLFAGRAVAAKPISLFYKVDDAIRVWLRGATLLPSRQDLWIDESNERAVRRIFFDHDRGVAHFWRDRRYYRRKPHRQGLTERDDPLVPGSFDPISLFFRLRCVEADVGDAFALPVYDNGKNHIAQVRVEAEETIATPLGRKRALRVRITWSLEGRMKSERPITAWVSSDVRRLPLRVVAHLPFANLRGMLVGYRPRFGAPIEGELDPSFVAPPEAARP